ncbi:MAG TPA: ComEC/Rec2 family competence protein [Cytophagaceae bacterium]|jgi:competence protein ComEC|nr:ComEC/Rec2 family competence protein [Cytophagaceae bacterium]
MRFFFWTKYPFVQVGSSFIIGTALAYAFIDLPEFFISPSNHWYLLVATLSLALITAMLLFYYCSYRSAISGVFILLLFVILGFLHFLMYDERCQDNHLTHIDATKVNAVIGQVITEPELKNNLTHFVFRVREVRIHNHWISCNAKVKVTKAFIQEKTVGLNDCLLIRGTPTPVDLPDTPYDFNYTAFLAYQNIHYTLYSKKEFLFPPNNTRLVFSPKQCAIQAQQFFKNLLKTHIRHAKAYALVTGLLIGIRSDLTYEDKQLFTNSGTIHILAVSGMHVVLIFQCIAFIAGLFKIKSHGFFFNLFVLLLIWFYIFITGLQASACRAAIMISMLLIGNLVQRENRNINSLFASACLMLLYNPYYLADAGFILSFLAVAGILVSSTFSFEKSNKIKDYIVGASLISTAAQLATFPYSIHLFHQFPVYFLLANLLIVPLSTLLLFLSVLLLLVCYIPYVGTFTVYLIEIFTDFLFCILQFIDHLPWHTIHHISLSALEAYILYFLFIAILLMILLKKIHCLWVVLSGSIVFSASLHYRMIDRFNHPSLFISGKKETRQYVLSHGHEALILQHHIKNRSNNGTELFLTDHFIQRSHRLTLPETSSCILQQGDTGIMIVFKKPHSLSFNEKLTKKCTAVILDYTTKSSYIHPTKNTLRQGERFFPLQGKKSFYMNTLAL